MTHLPRHRYLLSQRAYEHRVLEEAAEILEQRYVRGETFARTENTTEYLRCKLAGYEHEMFAVLFLDNQHRLIEFKELFRGTVDAAGVVAINQRMQIYPVMGVTITGKPPQH